MHTAIGTTTRVSAPLGGNTASWMRHWVGDVKGRARSESPVRIGLALGGGFARGIAHAGVLRVLEQHRIPIHCVTGISAGAIVAAAYASGTPIEEIVRAGCSMRLGDVGRFSLGRMGLVGSGAMHRFLTRLLSAYRFQDMRTPLGVVATDLATGEPAAFADSGEVFDPIRASCAYPGLFQPVSYEGRLLVDGAMSMGVPAALARELGATHVISVPLPPATPAATPNNMFQVVSRCFQILQGRFESSWRSESDLVMAPQVGGIDWNAFGRGAELVQAGESAARAAIFKIREWLSPSAAAREATLQLAMAY